MQAVTELFPHSGQRLARQGESSSVMNLEVLCCQTAADLTLAKGQGTSFCTENEGKEINCIRK